MVLPLVEKMVIGDWLPGSAAGLGGDGLRNDDLEGDDPFVLAAVMDVADTILSEFNS